VTIRADTNLRGGEPVRAAHPAELRPAPVGSAVSEQSRRRLAVAIERHHPLVWRTLRRFGVPARDVEDAAQQVFMTFLAQVDALGAGKEAAFLVAVAVRVAANARRKVQRSPEVLGEDVTALAAPATPEGLLGEKQLREELDRALATLPLEQRAVFVLYELEGFTVPEIAEALQVPLGTATSRLRRARIAFEAWVAGKKVEGGEP
jgi:RNA polymerase sigma-70 factor (ECF subfamily)